GSRGSQRPMDDFVAVARRFWHPVARASDVERGHVVAATLLDQRLAVWRDRDGGVQILEDTCPHRGTRLSLGGITNDDCLMCPYHGWKFDRHGTCVLIPQLPADRPIPGRAKVRSFRVSEHAGLVWTCLVDEPDEVRPRPTWDVAEQPSHWVHVGEVYDWDAQAFRQVENFCDVGHFSVLHTDTFGNPALQTVEPYGVDLSDDGWRLSFDYPYTARNPAQDGVGAETFDMVFEYRLELPFTVALGNASGPGTVLCMASSPVSATRTRVFWICAFPTGAEVDSVAYEALEARIWEPDRKIVQSQLPRWLPLDLREELQLPFDRLSVMYRRRLADIGFPVVPAAQVAL
ncbi:MAG: aromatic ring-hydroxylating dioxygenase subunit alpha, partial [Acidimicrobiaceae bacterium]|nr:aromatic ring-hydroxylating dioxygenase subunit alpha [Acidimicrobiaceae bacterium]